MNGPGIDVAEGLLRRIYSEYMEMPGLRLTAAQAQRLWGLDDQTCAGLLELLIELKFLHRTGDGGFARLTEGGTSLRMAKVQLDSNPASPETADTPSAA